MGKAEFGTAKYVANKMKAKGLSKLKFYCQICEKQCRDDNGFKCHIESPSHLRKVKELAQDPMKRRNMIEDYSKQFQNDFVRLLKMSHGEKEIGANRFYQEYIGNKEHIHMNSTKWKALSQFVKHLGDSGICTVIEHGKEETDLDENEEEDEEEEEELSGEKFTIAYIDKSSEAIRRKELGKQKQSVKTDEESSLARLQEQINRAKRNHVEEEEEKSVNKRLRDANHEPIKLSISKVSDPPRTIMKCGMRIKPDFGAFKIAKPDSNKLGFKKADVFKKENREAKIKVNAGDKK
ncbi:unnamed protein product [Kuraishia capsulata CBS 1993]|uniref:C2H2-type domain-containing protein n=1 Tax=Kuraishia capsulata CBS 1993 TaxID=1382522 RepID=W6MY57_9ASCO|nr:uncharacterized protein KUCA_T00006050001 [Kuraishia capsulata CBS 1993]CDK30055.1 unnamed protein product [Kuraishia capsulata CBS 1993]